MKLSELQYQTVDLFLTSLLERVCVLRIEGKSAPSEDALHRLFTDTAAYAVDFDEEVNVCRAELHGLAVGLGLPSSLDLFVLHRGGFLERGERLPSEHFVKVALRAVAVLAAEGDPALRAVAQELTEALLPVKGRCAAEGKGGKPWTNGS